MWSTEFNHQENTMTHTFPCDILVFVDMNTNEVSEFKDGVLKNRRSDPTYCQDRHYARLLEIASDVKKIQAFA